MKDFWFVWWFYCLVERDDNNFHSGTKRFWKWIVSNARQSVSQRKSNVCEVFFLLSLNGTLLNLLVLFWALPDAFRFVDIEHYHYTLQYNTISYHPWAIGTVYFAFSPRHMGRQWWWQPHINLLKWQIFTKWKPSNESILWTMKWAHALKRQIGTMRHRKRRIEQSKTITKRKIIISANNNSTVE